MQNVCFQNKTNQTRSMPSSSVLSHALKGSLKEVNTSILYVIHEEKRCSDRVSHMPTVTQPMGEGQGVGSGFPETSRRQELHLF